MIGTLLPLAAISGTGKAVLIVVAATFILWSLVTALSIPKRDPGFPRNMGMFLTISAVLFVAQMTAVVWVTGTQEVEETAQEAGGGETTPEETTPGETTTTEETTGGDAEAGKAIFTENCAACHTLADAGATGSVGPDLDAAKPALDLVLDRVTNGKGGMPSFKGQLSEEQIQDVSAYVASAAGA